MATIPAVMVGDYLRCATPSTGLTVGHAYYVVTVTPSGYGGNPWVEVARRHEGVKVVAKALADRFEKVDSGGCPVAPPKPALPPFVYIFRDEDGDLYAEEDAADVDARAELVGSYKLDETGRIERVETSVFKAA